MYGSSSRNSSLPMVTFICGLMLLVALVASTDTFDQLRGLTTGCQASKGRLALALEIDETTEVACLSNYRKKRD